MLYRPTLIVILVFLVIRRRKVQIDNALKEVIYTRHNEEMDYKEILKYLINRYHFTISLNKRASEDLGQETVQIPTLQLLSNHILLSIQKTYFSLLSTYFNIPSTYSYPHLLLQLQSNYLNILILLQSTYHSNSTISIHVDSRRLKQKRDSLLPLPNLQQPQLPQLYISVATPATSNLTIACA